MKKKTAKIGFLWREVCGTCEWWDAPRNETSTEKEESVQEDVYGHCANRNAEFHKNFLLYSHAKCTEYERSLRTFFKK